MKDNSRRRTLLVIRNHDIACGRGPAIVFSGHNSIRLSKATGLRNGFLILGTLGGLVRGAGFSLRLRQSSAHRNIVETARSLARILMGANPLLLKDAGCEGD